MSFPHSCPRQTVTPFLPVTFSFAVIQSLLPHSPPFCDTAPLPNSFFHVLRGQSCEYKSVPPGQRHRKGWWLHMGGRQKTRSTPCPSLPAALFSTLCATHTANNLSPSLFVCLPLCCLAAVKMQLSHLHLALPLFPQPSVFTQEVTGLSKYIANSSYYRVPYQMTCKCVRIVQETSQFIIIDIN